MKNKKLVSSHTIPLEWDISISVLKNPLLWLQLFMVSLISSSYLLFLLIGLNLYEYQWENIPSSFTVFAVMSGGLFLALSLILFLLYGRGIPTRYILHDDHIEQHTSMRGKKIVGWLSLFALFSGKNAGYTAAGANLLAQSKEQIAIKWQDVSQLQVFPKRKEIQLHNEWRTIMQIICTDEQFEIILQIIKQNTTINSSLEKSDENSKTPFAIKVILSLLSLVFGLFLFPRLPIHFIGIFTIATMLFAYLALWFDGLKKLIFGGILFLLPVVGIGLAFIVGEVSLDQSGAMYALLIELVALGFFTILGLTILFKRIT